MRKINFYSMVREGGKPFAKPQTGYTDGTYNYYNADGTWFAIHPVNGLSICNGRTRKEAAEKAHAPRVVKMVEAALKRQAEAATHFAEAVEKAEGMA